MKLIAAFTVFISLNSLAHIEFSGKIKGSNKPCSLHIQQTYYAGNDSNPRNFRADVVAILEDDHHIAVSHAEELFFTVSPAANMNVLSGMAQNKKDQINVMRKAGTTDLSNVEAYAVKWLHHNHFHSAQCLNLKRVKN